MSQGQGYFEFKDPETGKAKRHQEAIEKSKSKSKVKDISNAEIMPSTVFKHNRAPAGYDETIIMNDITIDGGHIEIMENSPYADGRHAVTTLYVDEDKRRQGIGSKLVDEFIRTYKTNLSAQTSNLNSVKLFYSKGFRPEENEHATLDEAKEMYKNAKGGSIGMIYDNKEK